MAKEVMTERRTKDEEPIFHYEYMKVQKQMRQCICANYMERTSSLYLVVDVKYNVKYK